MAPTGRQPQAVQAPHSSPSPAAPKNWAADGLRPCCCQVQALSCPCCLPCPHRASVWAALFGRSATAPSVVIKGLRSRPHPAGTTFVGSRYALFREVAVFTRLRGVAVGVGCPVEDCRPRPSHLRGVDRNYPGRPGQRLADDVDANDRRSRSLAHPAPWP
jgi:hypothetical protein